MKQKQKKLAKKELEKIYDSRYKWLQAGKDLRDRFKDSLQENPKLTAVLHLVVMANIGIWFTAFLIILRAI